MKIKIQNTEWHNRSHMRKKSKKKACVYGMKAQRKN